jgi:hypothetical protein
MMKTKQVKRDSNDVHIYSKFEEQVFADYDRTEDIEKGVHAISECMKYMMDNFSMIARDVIVSFHSEGGDEVKGKVDCFQLKQVDDGQRWFDFSGMNIQVRSKDGDVEAGLDDTSGVLRFPTAVSLQALEETSVSCSLNGPLRIYICPSFLDTYARIFASMTTHGEQTTGNDTSTLHISILRALNLPMLSEDIRITSNAVSHNASSVSDEDLIDSMAELMSTLFMSTSESFYWEDSPTEAHDMVRLNCTFRMYAVFIIQITISFEQVFAGNDLQCPPGYSSCVPDSTAKTQYCPTSPRRAPGPVK